ncbi:MAG: diacylglycerol kinase [Proteobacteria bacterium]|nr:diacylglycerol kinase [Pseudomonadota bacterium]
MEKLKNQSFLSRLRFAGAGIICALATERSMRVHLVALILAIAALLYLQAEPLWWALLALSGAAVIASELVNTALENLVDHLHPELHPRIRVVKDCAAGAVLIAALGALGVAAAFLAHLLHR